MKNLNKVVCAFDTENDWTEDNEEVILKQTCFVTDEGNKMIVAKNNDLVEDRVEVLQAMIDYASLKKAQYIFYCANLKHESELLKEGFKIIQTMYHTTYMRRDSSMMQIQIEIDNGSEVVLRDIFSNYPGTNVKGLGQTFGLPKLDGFEFKAGWSKGVDFFSPENYEYCFRDAEIVKLAADELHRRGLHGITLSSVAWRKAKEILNGVNPISKSWNRYFPKLSRETDEFVRKAYFGGLNFSSPNFRDFMEDGVDYGCLIHEDASSMYPTVGVMDLLPYGEPIKCGKDRPFGLGICRGEFDITLKENRPDFLNLKFRPQLEEGGYILHLTNIDLDLLYYCYEVTRAEIEEWMGFKSQRGLMKDWFLRWYEGKETAKRNKDKVEEMFCKYMLNALTGRFGLRRVLKDCKLLDDWTMFPKEDENGDAVENDDSYIPYVAFMTAHARRRLIANSKFYNPLIHMDTDSTIGYRKTKPISLTALGGWNIEKLPIDIIEGGFKRYYEILPNGKYKLAAAGVPQKTTANGCPIGPWIEILDNPSLLKINGYEIGNEEYCVQSPELRQQLIDNGFNPDKIDTRKLYPKKAYGGYVYVPGTMKLNDNLRLRFGG